MAEYKAFKPQQQYNENVSKPIEIKRDLFEFLMKYGSRIALRVVSSGAGALIYQVPEGNTFFLMSVSISGDNGNAAYAKLYIVTGDQVLAELDSSAVSPAAVSSISSNFSIPLRINPGEEIYGESTGEAVHVIVGYLIPTADIY